MQQKIQGILADFYRITKLKAILSPIMSTMKKNEHQASLKSLNKDCLLPLYQMPAHLLCLIQDIV